LRSTAAPRLLNKTMRTNSASLELSHTRNAGISKGKTSISPAGRTATASSSRLCSMQPHAGSSNLCCSGRWTDSAARVCSKLCNTCKAEHPTPFDTNWMNGSAVTPLTTQDLCQQDELSILTAPANHLGVEGLVSYYPF
jgi:hypothetical protein